MGYCTRCKACAAKKGKRWVFRARWTSETTFTLRVLQRGQCAVGDSRRSVADDLARENATKAALTLQRQQGAVAPGDVVRALAQRGERYPRSTVLRGLMKRMRQQKSIQPAALHRSQLNRRALTWTG